MIERYRNGEQSGSAHGSYALACRSTAATLFVRAIRLQSGPKPPKQSAQHWWSCMPSRIAQWCRHNAPFAVEVHRLNMAFRSPGFDHRSHR